MESSFRSDLRPWTRIVALLVGAASGALGCSDAPAGPLGRQELAVLGGAADVTHSSVVSIETTRDAARPELCSGVVIAPRVVLTAGHCTLGHVPSDLLIGIGGSAQSPNRTALVAEVHTYPRYDLITRANNELGLDLGVIVVADDLGVPSIPLARDDAAKRVGSRARLIGFGQTSPTDLETRGRREAAEVTINGACSTLLRFGDASTNACHGDSGGPLLAFDAAGAESVAAIVSFGTDDCHPPSYAVRTDVYARWIDSVVAGTADDTCATSCPPPASDCAPMFASDAGDVGAETADAGIDASRDAASPDAPADASPPTAAASDSSGCALSPHHANESTFFSALVLAAAWLASRLTSKARATAQRPTLDP